MKTSNQFSLDLFFLFSSVLMHYSVKTKISLICTNPNKHLPNRRKQSMPFIKKVVLGLEFVTHLSQNYSKGRKGRLKIALKVLFSTSCLRQHCGYLKWKHDDS